MTPDDNGSDQQPVRLAYLLKRFPRLSETFILQEMLALEALGLPLRVYAVMDPNESVVPSDVSRLRAPVTYLPAATLGGVTEMAGAHLAMAWHSPGRWLRALAYAVWRRDALVGLRHFWRAGWLARELRRMGIEHLHAHFANGPAALASFVHRLSGLPYSFTAHAKDIYTTPQNRLAERLGEAKFVVTCTAFNAGYLADIPGGASTAPIHRIYHGVDLQRFQPATKPLDDPPVILGVGRLVEKKGFTYLMEACALLRQRGIRFRCVLIGTGPLVGALRARIDALDLADHVALSGAVTQDELVPIYQQATVMALPCVVLENGDRDGIPNVLVEAMHTGLPVISTPISGIPELISDGENGLLVPPRDVLALANALTRLLTSPHERDRLAANARQTIRERFDLTHNASTLARLFRGDSEAVARIPPQAKNTLAPAGRSSYQG